MKILSAFYGSCNINAVDVTPQVQTIVNSAVGTASVLVNSATFNIPDPDAGTRKSLTITFTYGIPSVTLKKSAVDGTTITLDLVPNHFEIVSAYYGTTAVYYDITKALQIFTLESVANSSLVVGSSSFFNQFTYGFDIAYGVPKTLTVSFFKPGSSRLITVCANDGQTLDFNRAF
ncbi:hypothetical protein [Emticicia sp. TH156]|uniref:hypothetical protein n=1 Tax=Emticicia sp. TH156 TaxID=2067454 RepID=UPI000C75FCF9|nr:hypothetical protein [Emticicia sp. TH156]PLK44804.1 hypothetical protein C0V77_10200 [Emticicia sp. TH156]